MWIRLLRWFIFTVLVALAPLLVYGASTLIEGNQVTDELLFGKGELLLICCALAAAAIGDIITSGRELETYKLICGGSCVIVVFFTSALYDNIAQHIQLKTHYEPGVVANLSIISFTVTIISAAACLALSRE